MDGASLAAHRKFREDGAVAAVKDPSAGRQRTIAVSYGSKANLIGTLEVDTETTFHSVRRLLVPLLSDFFAGMAIEEEEEKESARRLLRDFVLLDHRGQAMDELRAQATGLYEDLVRDDCQLLIRNSDCVLPSGPDDDEIDNFTL